MRKLLLSVAGAACVLTMACGGAATTQAPDEADTVMQAVEQTAPAADVQPAADATQVERHDVVYVCNCGPTCDCKSVSTKPGTCACGKDLAWAHVVKIEGDEASLCTCSEGCTCSIDANDPTKCGCGRELRRISLKGTGLYFCNCGGSCTCNHVSSEPGTCACGMELKQAV